MADSKGGNDDTKKKNSSEVSEAQKELAQNAQNEFNKKNYGGALFNINKLLNSRPKDIKVQVNKAVAEYFKSNLKKTDAFMKALMEICSQANVKIDKVQQTDDADVSIVRLNYCTVLFHKMQYRTISPILEKMHANMSSLDDAVSIALCLLLIECYLKMAMPDKAIVLVKSTEDTFLPSPLRPQTSAKPLPAEKDSKSPDKILEKFESSTPLLSTATLIGSGDEAIGTVIKGTIEQECLREKLQLMRMRALLNMRLIKLAEREIVTVVSHANTLQTTHNPTLVMTQSCLDYINKDYTKAIERLNKCNEKNHPDTFYPRVPVAYYNNLAAVYMATDKPRSANIAMRKANELLIASSKTKEKPEVIPLYSIGSSLCPSVNYNLGLTLLKTGQPELAFDCLVETAQIHCANPRVWLRLAECCISIHKMNKSAQLKDWTKESIIKGKRPLLQLHPGINYDKHLSDQISTTEAAVPIPRLEFARLCLRNCLYLIADEVPSGKYHESGEIEALYDASPSVPIHASQLFEVKAHCFLSSAFVCLCLGDFHTALQDCKELLQLTQAQPDASSRYRYLANIYGAEALIKMGQPAESLKYLNPNQTDNINEEDIRKWLYTEKDIKNHMTPKFVLNYNTIVAHALNQAYHKAFNLFQQVLGSVHGTDIPANFYSLGIYIAKKIGKSDIVAEMLYKHLAANKY